MEKLIIMILFALIMVGLVIYNLNEKLDNRQLERLEKCKSDCNLNYNSTFVDYESSGYKNEECWCRKNQEPMRIW